MEEGKVQEPQKPADEIEKPKKQSIIISANGLKITSKLNPDAKEFYPAHLIQRNLYRQTFSLPVKNEAKILPNIPTTNVGAVRNILELNDSKPNETDIDTIDADVKQLEKVHINEADGQSSTESVNEHVEETKDMEKVVEKQEVEQQEAAVAESSLIEIPDDANNMQENKEIVVDETNELVTVEEVQEILADESTADIIDEIEDTEEDTEKEKDSIEENSHADETLRANDEIQQELTELDSDELIDIDQEFTTEEPCELPQIIEEIKENISLCGDIVTESVGDVPDNNVIEQHKSVYDVQIVNQMDIIPESIEVLEVRAPPPTPTDESRESHIDEALISRSLKEKSVKEDKKKSEKRSTTRKFTSFSLGLSRKSSSGHAENSSMKNSSSGGGTRTKRISESLHNLSTSLKSKSDSKKSDGSPRLLPRSTTSIPRPPVRSRTLLSKPSNECNGVSRKEPKYRLAKDAVSLKSTSSTDRSVTSKSSVHGSNKTLSSKSSATSTKNTDKPTTTTMAAKSKDSPMKPQPRGTVASSLRQTEAQKRRNLFPNDDPESNIELSQFLFK